MSASGMTPRLVSSSPPPSVGTRASSEVPAAPAPVSAFTAAHVDGEDAAHPENSSREVSSSRSASVSPPRRASQAAPAGVECAEGSPRAAVPMSARHRPVAPLPPSKLTTRQKVFFAAAALLGVALLVVTGVALAAAFVPAVAGFIGVASGSSLVLWIGIGCGIGLVVDVIVIGVAAITVYVSYRNAVTRQNAKYAAAVAPYDRNKAAASQQFADAEHLRADTVAQALQVENVLTAARQRVVDLTGAEAPEGEACLAEIQRLQTEITTLEGLLLVSCAERDGMAPPAELVAARERFEASLAAVQGLADREVELRGARAARATALADIDRLYAEAEEGYSAEGRDAQRAAWQAAIVTLVERRDAVAVAAAPMQGMKRATQTAATAFKEQVDLITELELALSRAQVAQADATAAWTALAGKRAQVEAWRAKDTLEKATGLFSGLRPSGDDQAEVDMANKLLAQKNDEQATAQRNLDVARQRLAELHDAQHDQGAQYSAAYDVYAGSVAALAAAQQQNDERYTAYIEVHGVYEGAFQRDIAGDSRLREFLDRLPAARTTAEGKRDTAQAALGPLQAAYEAACTAAAATCGAQEAQLATARAHFGALRDVQDAQENYVRAQANVARAEAAVETARRLVNRYVD